MSKKLEEKQQRRLVEEQKRREIQRAARKRNMITIAIALVVAIGAVFLIKSSSDGGDGDAAAAGVTQEQAGCDPIQTPEEGSANHVEEGTDVQYSTTPPTSGDHYATPANAGFFSEPVPEETVVHNLEHGQIVIWYSPDAPQATIDAIESVVDDEPIGLVATPYDGIPSGSGLVFTAWGASQSCADFSNTVLCEFRNEFQGRGPEQVGIPTFDEDCTAA